MRDGNPPRPYAGATSSHTTVYNCANSIIAAFLIIFKGRFGVCVCMYAVWGFHIPRRFLFASMGTPSGGREWEYHPQGKYH